MEPLHDLTSVRKLLRDGITKGYWTLEDLDVPSMGWAENAAIYARNYPLALQQPWHNLLRDGPTPEPEAPSPPLSGPLPGFEPDPDFF